MNAHARYYTTEVDVEIDLAEALAELSTEDLKELFEEFKDELGLEKKTRNLDEEYRFRIAERIARDLTLEELTVIANDRRIDISGIFD